MTEQDEPNHFLRARTVAGLLIYGLIAVLALFDAVSTDYGLDSIQLALMLGTGGVLLGVEPLARLLK